MFPSLPPPAPAPMPPGPPPPTAPARGVATDPAAPPQRVLTADQVSTWRSRVKAALEATKPAIDEGKVNVARYMGKYLATAPKEDEALVPTDFYYIEAKRSRLFYRLPDVFVKPEQPGLEDAAVVFQAALNKELGPRGVNVLPTVQQVIFDVLCPTGFGAVALGYQTVLGNPPQVPVPIGQNPDGSPATGLGANIVASWYFAEHVRPGDLLVAPEFVGQDFDKAPWVGQRFREDVPETDGSGTMETDDRRLVPFPSGATAGLRKQRTGYEIWYRAHLFDADVQHPDKIRMFKFYEDDKSESVTVQDHPHQRYANAAGKLKAGMRGFGIKPLTLRYISDSWMPPSDCTMARNTADELSRGRTQMLRSRDRNLPQWGFDATRVDRDVQAKVEKNEMQGGIPFNGPGADATWPIQKGTPPRETYQFNEVCQQDLTRIWRMGDNQVGVLSETSRTATESQITQSSSQEANEADRGVVLSWYTDKIVAELAALMQLYADQGQFVELVGADAQRLTKVPPEVQQQAKATGQDARVLVPWNKDLIQGLFAFSARPNSQVFLDAAQEKKQLMDLYQFFANEPTVNRAELTRAIITRYGFDPSKIMQQPPPKSPPPPNGSFSFTGQDFSPLSPQSPIVIELMQKLGMPIDAQSLQAATAIVQQMLQAQAQAMAAQPPQMPGAPPPAAPMPETAHGGAVAKAEPLAKHPLELTGNLQGTGAHAPLGAGGLR